ncbi:MAG: ABC transporter permease [Streptomyces sp.]|nr:ABC transporter permease [Streptomyces sp.]
MSADAPAPASASPQVRATLPSAARLRLRDVLAVGVSGLRGRTLRAVLSALGIAIGVGAMVAVVGIGTSSQARLLDQIRGLGTNLLTVSPGSDLFGDQARLPVDAVALTERIGAVQRASATGETNVSVYRSDRIDPNESGGIDVLAADAGLPRTVGAHLALGRYPDAATGRFPTVVLGSRTARHLGVDAVGGQVWLGGQWFTVLGILQPVPLAPELDSSALVGWPAAQQYLGFDGHPTTVYTRSQDGAVPQVQTLLAATVDPADPSEVNVSRPSDALMAQAAAQDTFSALLLGLGAVALLVGGVGVANTMVIAVLERRQEIGLRRAIGAHRGQIRLQFLTEAVTLAGAGGAGGAVLGCLATYGYALAKGWPFAMPFWVLATTVAASALVGAVAGLYPAARAARMTPTQALSAL